MKRADEATERVWGNDPNTPTTYASLGENKPPPKEIGVPMALQAAPALLGVGAALVFVFAVCTIIGPVVHLIPTDFHPVATHEHLTVFIEGKHFLI